MLPENNDSPLKGLQVMFCDDHHINIMLFTKILQSEGMIVDSFPNGKLALEKFLASPEGHYKLLLTDFHMPEMNGEKLAESIRESGRSDAAKIMIVLLTGESEDSDISNVTLDQVFDLHLDKPISAVLLKKALAELIRQKGLERSAV